MLAAARPAAGWRAAAARAPGRSRARPRDRAPRRVPLRRSSATSSTRPGLGQDALVPVRPRHRPAGCAGSRAGRPGRPARPAGRRRRGARRAAARAGCCRSGSVLRAGRGTTAGAGRRTAERRPAAASAAGPAVRRPAPIQAQRECGRGGASNRLRMASSTPSAARSRAISRVASREWPPRSKKPSSVPTARPGRAPRRTGAQSTSSCGVRGARGRRRRSDSGAGRAAAVELAVRGQRQRVEHDDRGRHHVVGQPSADMPAQRRAGRPRRPPGHDVGDQPLVARPVLAGQHRRLAPRRDARASAASTSPGSIRKPRILTWWSARPRNSRLPSGRQRGQVAGAVHPARPAAERVGDEPLRGQAGPAEIAARQPGARDVQLARHAHRHRAQPLVQHVDRGVGRSAGRSAARSARAPSVGPDAVAPDRGLGRAVEVDACRAAAGSIGRPAWRPRQRLAADQTRAAGRPAPAARRSSQDAARSVGVACRDGDAVAPRRAGQDGRIARAASRRGDDEPARRGSAAGTAPRPATSKPSGVAAAAGRRGDRRTAAAWRPGKASTTLRAGRRRPWACRWSRRCR